VSPQVSVIIATYNRRAVLERTLPTILQQDLPHGEYEVMVVDDGSRDGTAEWVGGQCSRYPHLRLCSRPHRGQSAAINSGIEMASGQVLLFLDDDILCGPELVRTHWEAHLAGPAAVVFGPVLLSEDSPQGLGGAFARSYCDDFFRCLTPAAASQGWFGCVASANSSLPRTLLEDRGGLDETFSRGNDVELGIRLRESGVPFRYQPRATAWQIFTKTANDLVEEAHEEGIAEVRLCRKHSRRCLESHLAVLAARPARMISALARFPLASLLLYRALPAGAEAAYRAGLFRSGCMRLLHACRAFAFYRGALELAGSREALRREFASPSTR
jgi:GT2 family glycosyltransferase